MSSSASTSKNVDGKKPAEPAKGEETQTQQPHLGVLEEDDEFEEFPVAGV
jgi:26 proteasome complex subunit DSS1